MAANPEVLCVTENVMNRSDTNYQAYVWYVQHLFFTKASYRFFVLTMNCDVHDDFSMGAIQILMDTLFSKFTEVWNACCIIEGLIPYVRFEIVLSFSLTLQIPFP